MRIISLNTWGGRGGKENLLNFFKKHKDVDVFCLQEMWNGGEQVWDKIASRDGQENLVFKLVPEVAGILTNHNVYFRPHYYDWYGLAVFIKKDLKVAEEGELFVYKERGYADPEEGGNHARNIQWVTFDTKTGPMTIVNFHGLWNGQGKTDTDDRLLQSDNIINFLKNLKTPHLICGDFNLRPDTQSVKKFEDFGLRNLIKEYGITSTRTSLYTKSEKFADYVFTSPEIEVKNFEVLPDQVSDHAALFLEI